MKKKSLIMALIGVALSLCFVVFGVFAATYLKLNLQGQIDFLTFDKLAYVEEVKISNFVENDNGQYYAKSKTLSEFKDMYLKKDTASKTIDLSKLTVMNGERLEIAITMISLEKNKPKTGCHIHKNKRQNHCQKHKCFFASKWWTKSTNWTT